jgi:hypothetical protein
LLESVGRPSGTGWLDDGSQPNKGLPPELFTKGTKANLFSESKGAKALWFGGFLG